MRFLWASRLDLDRLARGEGGADGGVKDVAFSGITGAGGHAERRATVDDMGGDSRLGLWAGRGGRSAGAHCEDVDGQKKWKENSTQGLNKIMHGDKREVNNCRNGAYREKSHSPRRRPNVGLRFAD